MRTLCRMLRDVIGVQFNPETRCGRQREIAVDDFGQPGCGPLEMLLDLEVRRAGSQVQIGGGQHRTADIVWRHEYVMRFGGGGELTYLADSAQVTDIGLDHIGRLQFEQLAEFGPVVNSLTGRYG